MPAAANLSNLKTAVGEAAPAVSPGAADMFATLVAASSAPENGGMAAVLGEGSNAAEPATEENVEAVAVDASILLPLLDQQRAAAVPVSTPQVPAQVVQAPAGEQPFSGAAAAAAPLGHSSQVSLAPAQAAAPVPSAPRAPSEGPAPQLEPVQNGAVDSSAPLENVDANPGIRGAATEAPGLPAQPQAAATSPAPEQGRAGREARTSPAAGAAAEIEGHIHMPAGPQAAAAMASAPIASALRRAAQPVPAAPAAAQANDPVPAGPPAGPPAGAGEAVLQLRKQALPPAQQERTLGAQFTPPEAGPEPLSSAAAAAAPLPTAAPAPATQVPGLNLQAAIEAQVLNVAKDGAWIDDLARDISRTASGEGTMRFRLAPETLGELRVEIAQSERGAHVRLQVTSEAAQQALAEAQPKLVQEARAQGVRIAETEISFAGGQSQDRDTGRQPQAEQPMRTIRSGAASTHSDAEAPSGPRRRDLYA